MTSISQIKMLSWTIQMIPTFLACLNNLAFTCNENTCIEILLVNQNIQYHDFDKQELQNPYWNLHDPIMTKNYQISKDMDIETMPHAMYFASNPDTVTKINHVP